MSQMPHKNSDILEYQNPHSGYTRVYLPVWRWFLCGFIGFILTFILVQFEHEKLAISSLILTTLFNLIAFGRSAFTNRSAGSATAAIVLIPTYVVILSGLTLNSHPGHIAPIAKAKTDIRTIEDAAEQFKIDIGRFPTPDEGIDILVENQSGLENWKGPYIKYQLDPWGNDYAYQFPGKINPASFDIISAGPDGIPDTEDDLSN
jgi:general secretion pathway protein G